MSAETGEKAGGMTGAGSRRWVWWWPTLLALLGTLAVSGPATAQPAYEVTPLGTDPARGVDRYRVTIRAGGTFYGVAVDHLPLLVIEEGEGRALELVEQAWRAQYPTRSPGDVQPDDQFLLEVPIGTFVSRVIRRDGERDVFESFTGDQLTTFPGDPAIAYRLRRAGAPDRAEVLINGGQAPVIEETKRVYDVDPPDFIQVRTVRGALQERMTRLIVDLTKKYLDDFRNYRERAVRIDDLPERLRAYSFDRAHTDIPFVRVEDGVGDETDPGNFPKVFRIAYFRDGTVRRYIVTETGDSLGPLTRPDSAAWTRILPAWQEWLPGQPEALPPFTPAISEAGTLLPGRILVVAFRPRGVQLTPQPTRPATGGSGLECLGVPIGLLLAAAAALGRGSRILPPS
jgi:hypothetical protein